VAPTRVEADALIAMDVRLLGELLHELVLLRQQLQRLTCRRRRALFRELWRTRAVDTYDATHDCRRVEHGHMVLNGPVDDLAARVHVDPLEGDAGLEPLAVRL